MKYIDRFVDIINTVTISSQYGNGYESGIYAILELLRACKKEKKTLYICGNGGSAGIAQHMTADFLKNGGLRTYNMYGEATITCISNDLNYDYVFCKQLELLANESDVLIAISSSGNSDNIIKAAKTMHRLGGKVISFTGFSPDNNLRKIGDINVYVPASEYGVIESIHNIILQQLVDEIVETDGIAMRMDTDE